MRRLPLLLGLALSVLAPSVNAQDSPVPTLTGYVTHVDSPTTFDVNHVHIQFTSNFIVDAVPHAGVFSVPAASELKVYLGQHLDLYGSLNKKTNTLNVARVLLYPSNDATIRGVAIIDQVPASGPLPGRVFRADGYTMMLPAGFQPSMHPPLNSADSPRPNLWLSYRGKLDEHGVLLLDRADLYANQVTNKDEKLRKGSELDPTSVDPADKQSGTSELFEGVDLKRIPAWHDATMQQRVERIGNSLLPQYQRALPQSDPTKIPFRFYLVDYGRTTGAISLPSGIILVPYQVVNALHNDSQVASVLASAIATLLERQISKNPALEQLAAALAFGTVGELVMVHHEKVLAELAQHQRDRVSLCLMHDAGYDITEAPEAWRILATPKGKDADKTALPPRSLTLYSDIGTLWRNPPAP